MRMTNLVAIHQPNFFPWIGYFDKIRRADTFVFLDDVAYPRSGSGGMGSWLNRVRLNVQGKPRWVTCPVRRIPLGSPIRITEIDDRQPWRIKFMKTLDANYRRARRYNETLELLTPLMQSEESNLARFNAFAIQRIAMFLGVESKFVHQSELKCEGSSTELLISITKAAGGASYLSGGGASEYQNDELFAERGIGLVNQQFKPQCYGEPARFLPGLSIIDYLMHDGRPLSEAFRE